jgi:lipopolysaccharide/colanic/teichoic acid biosynthesis glycosyltransferase
MTFVGYAERAELRSGSRALDVALVLLALPVYGPVVLAAAIAIKAGDGGPVLFWQRRLGRGRAPFQIPKLRTMNRGAITRVGRWLRPTGLDELPQFWSVLAGDMDLVGPRPLTETDVERLSALDPTFDARYRVRPGITGLAQVLGGASAIECSRLDRLYATRRNALTDLVLLGLSVAINVAGRRRVRALLSRL